MPISLHKALVPSWLQLLASAKGWLDKAEASELSEASICEARLSKDMLPFAYQVKSMAVHSIGAIEGVRAGAFSPDMSEPPADFAAMRARLEETEQALAAVTEDEMESFIGRDMRFEITRANIRMEFDAEEFLLSFSQPNFYFHATTAYDILRHLGIEVGKRDYLGRPRMRT